MIDCKFIQAPTIVNSYQFLKIVSKS